jgi:hypothetical protein
VGKRRQHLELTVPGKPLTAIALLAADGQGRPIVSVHVKRSYRLRPDGTCQLAPQQSPFLHSEAREDEERWPRESDILPPKLHTDLIVMARAVAPRGTRVKQMIASIELGERRWAFSIQGDRRCLYRGPNQVEFSAPEPFESMPLAYEHAYGGADPTVPVTPPRDLAEACRPHPGIYPRNPAGRGYVINDNRQHIEGLLLPNVEHPDDPLTPRRLILGSPERWWLAPRPWSCEWFESSWFPRQVFSGGLPEHMPADDSQLAEVKSGFLPPGIAQRLRDTPLDQLVHPRCFDAASPAMVLPFLRGDETVRFRGLTASGDCAVRLPARPPKVLLRFRRKARELQPVVNRVVISLEEMGVYLVWHAAWPAPDELVNFMARNQKEEEHDLRGVDVVIDGQPVTFVAPEASGAPG